MNQRQSVAVAISLVGGLLMMLSGCGQQQTTGTGRHSDSERKRYPHRKELETGGDGLVRLKGESGLFTGAVVHGDGRLTINYFASYEDGRAHGPEISYHDSGKISRIIDFQRGEKVRHREWFENGNPKIDAMMKGGIAYGRHLRWYQDGSQRFSAHFLDNLRWDGPVIDIGENGEVMWDAVFENGKYVQGVYPEEAQENLIERGLVKPEEAHFPIRGSGKSPEEITNGSGSGD